LINLFPFAVFSDSYGWQATLEYQNAKANAGASEGCPP